MRHPGGAAQAAAWLLDVGGAAMALSMVIEVAALITRRAPAADVPLGSLAVGAATVVALWATAAATRRWGARLGVLLAVIPLVGIALIVVENQWTRDASPGAQMALVMPVLYAAYHLRPVGAALATAAAVGALNLTAWSLLPVEAAFHDVVYGSTILVAAASVLMHARGVRDRVRAELEERTQVDVTTGASMRHVLDEAAAVALGGPAHPGTALIMIDLDHFKTVNDTFGHLAGDAALRHATGIIRSNTRPGDIVARMGGDELAVLLAGCDAESALRRARAMVEHLRAASLTVGGHLVALSMSAGVAHSSSHGADVEDLYGAADRALYRAKRDGRNRVRAAA